MGKTLKDEKDAYNTVGAKGQQMAEKYSPELEPQQPSQANQQKKVVPFALMLNSMLWAGYEITFICIPVAVWFIILVVTGTTNTSIWTLPAVPFLALSFWTTILRDGIKAFHRNELITDKSQRDTIIAIGLSGVIICTLLLTLSVLNSRGMITYLLPGFYELIKIAFWGGLALLFIVKVILIQRIEYKFFID